MEPLTSREGAAPPAAVAFEGLPQAPELVGGKGAALDRLVGWEVPVPASGAVTTVAYRELAGSAPIEAVVRRIRDGEAVSADDVDKVFDSVEFTRASADRIVAVAREVADGGRLAVRSSATVEDLSGSSFAGQYRSILDVDPMDAEAVLSAVRQVFASLWHPAPRAYRAAFGIDDTSVAMAAVLMQMVPARRAGVVFTVDPAGDEATVRVEAVAGLGESLVSGRETPDAWLVPRDLTGFDGPEDIAAAVRLALEVEERAGRPQDVEWAFDGVAVWVVQARPITVTREDESDGFDSPVDVARLTTAGIGEMLPGVLPPFRWQVASHLVNEAFAELLTDLGAGRRDAPARGPLVRRVRGRAALDFDSLRDLARQMPGGSPEELEIQYFGSQRSGRPTSPAVRAGSRWSMAWHDVRSYFVRRRSELEAEIAIRATEALGDGRELEALDDAGLNAYQLRLMDLAARATAAELAVAAAAASSYREIEVLLARHLDSAEAGRWAERATSVQGIVAHPDLRASAAVFAGPTWSELGTAPPSTPRRQAAPSMSAAEVEDALLAALEATPTWGTTGLRYAMRRRALRHMITEAASLLRRREATKAALLRLGGEVRRTALEQGRRLAGRGLLSDPDDIELLTIREIRRSFEGRGVTPRVLNHRRRWYQRYQDEPPLPRVFTGLPAPTPVELPPGGRLDGWAASPGRCSGTATVLSDPRGELEPGAILVAAATDASWSPLFVRAGAIVVDRGGPLSHAAILARELGVPAVLNVPDASRLLDGRSVTVDGDAGIVVVHDLSGSDHPTRVIHRDSA